MAVDILDEDHSLRLACYRLASDPALRDRLGRAARAHFSAAHTLEQMTTAFVRAIDSARDRPSQAPAGVPWRRPARPAAGEERTSW